MESIDMSALDRLSADLDALLEEAPERRRALHEKLAAQMKKAVDSSISGSGLNDGSGTVKSWQTPHVGSRGGYAAVRPRAGGTRGNNPGAITNYLENGHKIRGRKNFDSSYRPRINTIYVNGYHFYQNTTANIEAPAIAAAQEFVDWMAQKLEG